MKIATLIIRILLGAFMVFASVAYFFELFEAEAPTGNLLTLNNTGGVISTGAMQNTDFRSVPTGITGPLNPLTYNGALVEKPTSNFMPLTTDFSKFGR